MSDVNPYLAPPTPNSGAPMYQSQPYPMQPGQPLPPLPLEMKNVAAGLKLVMISMLVSLALSLLVGMVSGVVGAVIGIRNAGANPAQLQQKMAGYITVLSLLGIVFSGIVIVIRIMGINKMMRAPEETGALSQIKNALLASYLEIGIYLVMVIILLLGFQATSVPYLATALFSALIHTAVSIFGVLGLQKIAHYMQSWQLIKNSKTLFILTLIFAACSLISAAFGIVIGDPQRMQANPQKLAMLGLMVAPFGLGSLICGLWGLILFVITQSKMSTEIQLRTNYQQPQYPTGPGQYPTATGV